MAHGSGGDAVLNLRAVWDGKQVKQAQRDLEGLTGSTGKTTTATDKSKTVFDRAAASIEKVTVKKKQLIGTMNNMLPAIAGVDNGILGLTSSLGMVTANLGALGMGIGAAVMVLGQFIDGQEKAHQETTRVAESIFNEVSALGALSKALNSIRPSKEIQDYVEGVASGSVYAKLGKAQGLYKQALVSNLSAQMTTPALTLATEAGISSVAIEQTKTQADTIATEYIPVLADLQQIIDTSTAKQKDLNYQSDEYARLNDEINASEKRKGEVIEEAQQKIFNAYAASNIAISKQNKAGGGGIGKPKAKQAYSGLIPGVGAGGVEEESDLWYQASFGMTKEQFEMASGASGARVRERDKSGFFKAGKIKPKEVTESYGKELAQTTTTSTIQGLVAAAQSQDTKTAFKDMFANVLNSVLNSVIEQGVGMLFNPLGLSTGGSYEQGQFKSFDVGGGLGDFVGNNALVLGRKNRAIIHSGEVIQNPPQIENMIRSVISRTTAQAGVVYQTNLKTNMVMGRKDVERELDHATRRASNRRDRGRV